MEFVVARMEAEGMTKSVVGAACAAADINDKILVPPTMEEDM
jgi:hypothetical protein